MTPLSPPFPQPPIECLEGLLSVHAKNSCFSAIAEVVKVASSEGVFLQQSFYKKALHVMRMWGKNQDAITSIYKALRTLEGGSGNFTSQPPATVPPTTASISALKGAPRSGSSSFHNSSSSPPSSTHRQLSVCGSSLSQARSVGGGEEGEEGGSPMAATSMSLEGILQRSATKDLSSLLQLVEVRHPHFLYFLKVIPLLYLYFSFNCAFHIMCCSGEWETGAVWCGGGNPG